MSSLDDLLGGGLPLSCSLVIAAPDLHSSYGQLAQQYFVAEGLAAGHRVYVIDSDPEQFVKDTMWFPKSMAPKQAEQKEEVSDDEDQDRTGEKVKIAWRYEQMKQFQTTVSSQSQYVYLRCGIVGMPLITEQLFDFQGLRKITATHST